ncbi:MAG: hypothetical protein ABR593_01560 [Candidatus Limnocylindria bacterium]
MSCRRISRELLWLARFGELGPSSAPHLDHLADCHNCRDEVGFDRALVQQLRIALTERIEQPAPSPDAWDVILERAQAPERGLRAFLHNQAGVLAARLRTATAITAMALAGIIATSTQVSITHPQAESAETEVLTSAAGELFERQPLLSRVRTDRGSQVPVPYVAVAGPSDPEAAFLVSATLAAVGSTPVVEAPAEPPAEETTIESTVSLGATGGGSMPLEPEGEASPPAEASDHALSDPSAGEPF